MRTRKLCHEFPRAQSEPPPPKVRTSLGRPACGLPIHSTTQTPAVISFFDSSKSFLDCHSSHLVGGCTDQEQSLWLGTVTVLLLACATTFATHRPPFGLVAFLVQVRRFKMHQAPVSGPRVTSRMCACPASAGCVACPALCVVVRAVAPTSGGHQAVVPPNGKCNGKYGSAAPSDEDTNAAELGTWSGSQDDLHPSFADSHWTGVNLQSRRKLI